MRQLLLGSLKFYAVGFVLAAIYLMASISRSGSSTAAIGYLFVPFSAAVYALPFVIPGMAIEYLIQRRKGARFQARFGAPIASVIIIGFCVLGAWFIHRDLALIDLVKRVRVMNSKELREFLSASEIPSKFALGAVTENKKVDAELLHQIALIPDPELHRAMWSNLPIMGENTKGLAVMRLVARHRSVRKETLELLSKSQDAYVLGDIADSEKVEESTLRRLYEQSSQSSDAYLIHWGLARNRRTPREILQDLAKSEDYYTRKYARENPSLNATAPSEHLLAEWNRTAELEALLKKNPEKVNQLDKNGFSPIHHCAETGAIEACELLLKMGAQVDGRHPMGWTPLHAAASRGHLEMVKVLIASKANIHAIEKNGWSVLRAARLSGNEELETYLIQKGAK